MTFCRTRLESAGADNFFVKKCRQSATTFTTNRIFSGNIAGAYSGIVTTDSGIVTADSGGSRNRSR